MYKNRIRVWVSSSLRLLLKYDSSIRHTPSHREHGALILGGGDNVILQRLSLLLAGALKEQGFHLLGGIWAAGGESWLRFLPLA